MLPINKSHTMLNPGHRKQVVNYARNSHTIHKLKEYIIIRVYCPRAGPSLQVQEPRLQFCWRQVFHHKLSNQGCSFTRDWIGAVASCCFLHPSFFLVSEQTLKDLTGTNMEWGEWIWLTEPSGLHQNSPQRYKPVPSEFLTDQRSGIPNHPSPSKEYKEVKLSQSVLYRKLIIQLNPWHYSSKESRPTEADLPHDSAGDIMVSKVLSLNNQLSSRGSVDSFQTIYSQKNF